MDEHGHGRLLLTFSAAALAAQTTMARIAAAPPTVVERLERQQAATFLAQEEGEAVLDAAAWCLACVPLLPFPTRPDRYYALLYYLHQYHLIHHLNLVVLVYFH